MNKYNSRICCKHHSQRTFILIKFKEFKEFNQWKREFWYDQALKELSRRGI